MRQADGALEFRTPHGWVLPDAPAPSSVPDDAVKALRAANAAAGVRLDAQTARPTWLGEHFDVGHAISVLHPLAMRPSMMCQ